ncbi:MAG: hypothetical protein ACR2J4_04780 [Deinococcus sp.]
MQTPTTQAQAEQPSAAQAPDTAANMSALALNAGTRQLVSAGSTNLTAAASGSGALQWPEFAAGAEGNSADADGPQREGVGVRINRTPAGAHRGRGVKGHGNGKFKSNPTLALSINGLNLRDQRTANGGNQFTVEPPDQALCVGNGYVLESVNSVLRVFGTDGAPRTGVVDLNTFYKYPAAINRTAPAGSNRFGPFITDPVCYYDAPTQRWFHVVLTLQTNPRTGGITGTNTLDIAVSQSPDPTGSWNIYHLDVTNDGGSCPCLGDYPHIGADANGIYLTTNDFSLVSDEFYGAQLYALSKRALASGSRSVSATHLDLGDQTFTVWPAITPGNAYEGAAGGTEYFLSSNAVFQDSGVSDTIQTWALSNTRSLDSAVPQLRLNVTATQVLPYSVPGAITQKEGPAPLRDCLNDPTCSTTYLLGQPDPYHEVLAPLDGNDSRMQQVSYANGKLWGALDTGIDDNGNGQASRVGVAWYILKPSVNQKGVKSRVDLQGYLTAPGQDSVTRPALAVTNSGRGVIGMSLAGPGSYPSAAYASIDAIAGVGDVQVASAGVGPQDGFTGYQAFGGDTARWGDYGAAAADGKSIWVANEYIGQRCTLAEYTSAPLFSCGGTRVALGNWGTRISKLNF